MLKHWGHWRLLGLFRASIWGREIIQRNESNGWIKIWMPLLRRSLENAMVEFLVVYNV